MKEGLKGDLAAFLQVTGSPYQAVRYPAQIFSATMREENVMTSSWSGMFVQRM